jgi:serine/threonine protein kinase
MHTPDSIRFRQLESLFEQAIEIGDLAERERFLASACQGDDLLLREIRSLLEYEREIHSQTALPVFGPYQATRLIGRGGMGAVYEAVRVDGEFERTVAVKVMSGWALSPAAREHFRRERQILAYLDHPGIVRLFDGGVGADGSPYLAMELVEGERIDVYCRDRESKIRLALLRNTRATEAAAIVRELLLDRIGSCPLLRNTRKTGSASPVPGFVADRKVDPFALFGELLDAVEYAHSQGVIHRDIKPSNILVDQRGRVRVVDFGTARLIDPIQSIEGRQATQMRAVSADYASPELAAGRPVDERTDIYSLGAVYRELFGNSALSRKATAADPAERFADVAAMRQALSARRWPQWAAVAAALTAAAALALWMASPTTPASIRIEQAQQPSISADARWIAFERGNPAARIWLTDGALKRSAVRATGDEVRETQPALAPDGTFVMFRSDRDPQGVYRVDLRNGVPNGTARLIAPQGFRPRISPDSRWLAFSGSNYNGVDPKVGAKVFVVRADGGEPHNVSPHEVQHVAWMTDSRGLVLGFLPSSVNSNALIELTRVTWQDDSIANPTAASLGALPFLSHGGMVCGEDRPGRLWTASPPSEVGFAATAFRLLEREGSPLEVLRRPLIDSSGGSIPDACVSFPRDGATAYFSHRNESAVFELDGDTDLARFPAGSPRLVEQPANFANAPGTTTDGSVVVWLNGKSAEIQYRSSGKRETIPAEFAHLAADGKSIYIRQNGAWNRKTVPGLAPADNHPIPTLNHVWNFSPSHRYALITALLRTSRFISLVDTGTGASSPILQHHDDPQVNLYLATFSPDERWILFTAEGGPFPSTVFIAPFRGSQSVPRSEWIEVGRGDYPAWAPGGNRVYFTSNYGLETVALDGTTKRPLGGAVRVQELTHEAGWSLRGVPPGYFRVAVSREKLIYILGRRDALIEMVRQ